jgi:hypothetical protein
MSTRRAGPWRFDHGAQYFTVRDPRFARRVETWRREGIVTPWTAVTTVLEAGTTHPKDDDAERFVGVPGMNAVCRNLALGVDVSFETRVDRLARIADRWQLVGENGSDLGRFDVVVVSAPAPPTSAVLGRDGCLPSPPRPRRRSCLRARFAPRLDRPKRLQASSLGRRDLGPPRLAGVVTPAPRAGTRRCGGSAPRGVPHRGWSGRVGPDTPRCPSLAVRATARTAAGGMSVRRRASSRRLR